MIKMKDGFGLGVECCGHKRKCRNFQVNLFL